MGILDRIMRRYASTLETPSEWLREALVVGSSSSGVVVNESVALGIPAVLSAVKLIAEASASLPLKVYRRRADGGRVEEPEHPLYYVLHDAFNPYLTSFCARTNLAAAVLLHGNAYFEIERRGADVVGLYPVRADRCSVAVDERQRKVVLYTTESGREVKWTFDADLPAPLLHIAGSLGDGLSGWSTLKIAANALGIAEAESRYAGKFFANGAAPQGVLKTPNALTDEVSARIQRSWEAAHKGIDNAHKVAVLEEGLEWQATALNNEDAQLVESRQFSVQEIARIFRVPPHLLMDSSGSTSWGSGLESQTQAFLTYTLQPLLVNIEQAMRLSLLNRKTFVTHTIEHVTQGFARADLQARYSAYAVGRDKGWLSVNDVRELEGMNKVQGGDEYATGAPQPPEGSDPVEDDEDES